MSEHNPPPGGNSLHSQFMNLNIGAQPFIPNAQAPAFVPMPTAGHPPPPGYAPYNYNMQGGGARYNPAHMGMHQQRMHPQGGSYGMPTQQHGMGYNPHAMPDYHSHGRGGPAGPMPHHPNYSTGPRQQQPPPQVYSRHMPPVQPHPQQQQQSHPAMMHDTPLYKDGRGEPLPTKPSSSVRHSPQPPPPPVEDPLQEDPVDSWEQMAVDENSAGESSSTVKDEPPKATSESGGKSQTTTMDVEMEETETASVKQSGSEERMVQNKSTASATVPNVGAQLSTVSPHEGVTNGKKNTSPNLTKSSKSDSSSSKGAHVVVPPRAKDEKENLNVIFIGHVDAGKSTIGGHIMYLTGQVDKRTLEKYEREAKEKNRETWYLSWALDTNQEERDKGKTVEVGRAFFETDMKRFTILDAPGHAGFVPNMIGGAAQADVGVLVISARKGEFETGFERKGQTREHAMLAKTAGVKHLVVLVNKMDDPTVLWLEERFEECKTKLTPFLKKVGFNPKTDLYFIPVSGLTGANLKTSSADCQWYRGPPFITYLDQLPPIVREDNGILRMPIADKHKDMGTLVMGKIESGAVMKGSSLLLMPNKVHVEVLQVIRVEEEVVAAYSGDNVKLRLKGVEEEDISPGFVLCDTLSPCNMSQMFDAQIVILEYKSIICAGYNAVLHIHTVVEEVQVLELKALVDRKTGKISVRHPRFVKQDQTVIATLQTNGVICVENFKDFPQMARFTLRDEGKTIAIGKVLKVLAK